MIASKNQGRLTAKVICLVIVIVVFVFCVICQIPNVAAQSQNRATLVCEASRVGEGEIEVCLRLDEGKLCALAASLEYNADQFYFVGARIENALAEGAEKFVLSYICDGKRVKFIADGVKNAQNGAILARFYFKARREGAFELKFRLRGADGMLAAAIDGDGSIEAINVDLSRTQGRIHTLSDSKKPNGIKKPALMRASVEWEGESDCAELVLPIKVEGNCLAVGVKVFVLDAREGEYEVYYLAAQVRPPLLNTCDTAVRFSLPIAVKGRLCATVTPLLYCGNVTVEGEKTIFLINDGNLLCEQ